MTMQWMQGPNACRKASVVEIPFCQLKDHKCNLASPIRQAFGPSGLGILTVSGVPGLTELRKQLLPLAAKLGSLPQDILVQYMDPASSFTVGWSYGRKAGPVQSAGTLGSFYANPLQDMYGVSQEQFPQYYRPNIWPREHVPELEGAFKGLGGCMVSVGVMLAGHCSRYVQQQLRARHNCAALSEQQLQQLDFASQLQSSCTTKGRLLYYPPPCSQAAGSSGEWCSWHKDFGSLTALTAPMYIQEGPSAVEVPKPDPAAGLYVMARSGEVVQVSIPPGHLAFQVGRVLAIQSGGELRPTPHYVRAPAAQQWATAVSCSSSSSNSSSSSCYSEADPGDLGTSAVDPTGLMLAADAVAGAGVLQPAGVISRNTFAVFMQPSLSTPLVAPVSADDLIRVLGDEAGYWQDGMTFGEFARLELHGTTVGKDCVHAADC